MNGHRLALGSAAYLALAAALLNSCGSSGDGDEANAVDPVYRQRMRDFVIAIGQYARAEDPDFLLIPQNGHELLSRTPGEVGPPADDYIAAIDGMGQEDLLYGYEADNQATPAESTRYLASLLDLGEANGVEALVIDYCSDRDKMDDSYARNAASGYISLAADSRNLDDIPAYPAEPFRVNSDDIHTLSDAKNLLYLLEPSRFGGKEPYLEALRQTDYDLLIIDAFFDRDDPLTRDEVASLKTKRNGGRRLVVAYMSIGEAEDYRFYWQQRWEVGSPAFLDAENPEWEGNYKVRYWDPEWQAIIFGSPESFTGRLLEAGFDGAYLDIIDAFEYFE